MKSATVSTNLSSRLAFAALAVFLGIGLAPSPASAAVALSIVPWDNFETEGNSGNAIPFGTNSFCTDGIRYQQLYDGSQVGGGNVNSISFRLNGDSAEVAETTYTGVTITLSSTLATHATMSRTFAHNIGPDDMVVYSGDLTVNPSVSGSPNPFDFHIPFQHKFPFNGSNANLLVDITIEGCHGGATFFLDSQSDDNTVLRRFAQDKDDEIAEDESTSPGEGLITLFELVSEPIFYLPTVMGAGGNWAVVGHNGEGFLFEPLPNGTVVIFWFTYDLFGNQMWLLGVTSAGDFEYDSDTGEELATVKMYRTDGPSFGPEYDEDDYVETYIGNVTFRLSGCLASEGAHGRISYNFDFGFGAGNYDITKLYDISKNDCDP